MRAESSRMSARVIGWDEREVGGAEAGAHDSAYACLQWACARIGAILVTLNPAYRLPELVCPAVLLRRARLIGIRVWRR